MIFKIGDVVEFEKIHYRNKESFRVVGKIVDIYKNVDLVIEDKYNNKFQIGYWKARKVSFVEQLIWNINKNLTKFIDKIS